MAEYVCDSCGRRVTPPSGEAVRFCSFCGKPLVRVEAKDDDVIPLVEDAPAEPPPIPSGPPPLPGEGGIPALASGGVGGSGVPEVRVPPVVVPPPIPAEAPGVVLPALPSAGPVSAGPGDDFELRPLAPPAPTLDDLEGLGENVSGPADRSATPTRAGELDLAEAAAVIPLEETRCPNCGGLIPAGAEICTGCGYSRRLGRTLTTRVGSPEIPRHKVPAAEVHSPKEPQVEAERAYDRQRAGQRRQNSADTFRLVIATFFVLVFGGLLSTLPLGYLRGAPPFLPWRLVELHRADQQMHVAVILGLFLFVVVPITTLGVRLGIWMSGLETPMRLTFLRVAGTLSAVLLTASVVFVFNEVVAKLEPAWFRGVLIGEVSVALLVFTWYLQNVRFAGALALWLYTVVFVAIAAGAAGAAYTSVCGWSGVPEAERFLPPVAEWFGGWRLPG